MTDIVITITAAMIAAMIVDWIKFEMEQWMKRR
jgi:hypothetical protein